MSLNVHAVESVIDVRMFWGILGRVQTATVPTKRLGGAQPWAKRISGRRHEKHTRNPPWHEKYTKYTKTEYHTSDASATPRPENHTSLGLKITLTDHSSTTIPVLLSIVYYIYIYVATQCTVPYGLCGVF